MAYDPNLDQELFSETAEFENTRITVAVLSYNEAPPKLQISRKSPSGEDNWRFAKLGRLTKEEAEKVLPLMKKALEVM